MSGFYEKLKELNEKIAKDFTDDYHPDDNRYQIEITAPSHVDSNYPWLYVHFGANGPVSLNVLNQINKRFLDFCAVEGGSVETLHLNRRGPGFVVKLVYVHPKENPAQEAPGGVKVETKND